MFLGLGRIKFFSVDESASFMSRGGSFMSTHAGRFYAEYCLFFPRPDMLDDAPIDYFPQDNLSKDSVTAVTR